MNTIDLFLVLIELALFFTIYQITTRQEIKSVISAYRWQSFLLAATTGITAVIKMQEEDPQQGLGLTLTLFLFFLVILLPLALGIFIGPILVRATIFTPGTANENQRTGRKPPFQAVNRSIIPTSEQNATAERIWLLQKGRSQPNVNLLFFALLTGAAIIAFVVIPSNTSTFELPDQFGLFVSIALHLVGLYNTAVKNDIVSQAIGVLTMDHGLYLAVVKIVAIPVPATFFVLSLYAYTLITIALLIIIMPQVRHMTGSIDLDDISGSSELEG